MLISLLAGGIFLILLVGLVYFLGEYIAWIYGEETNSKGRVPGWLNWFNKLEKIFSPIENLIYRLIGIDPDKEMNWKEFLISLLIFNGVLFFLLFLIFKFQNLLPLNPLNLKGMSWDQAFHTASTFVSNTNQQHYGGESLAYITQILGVGLAMFLSAGTGLALAPAFTRGILNQEYEKLGNFWFLRTFSG